MHCQTCQTAEDVSRIVKDKEVSFIQIWFTDILGVLKSFSIRPSELEEAMTEGMGFDGSSIEGFSRIEESDMIAMPDPTTFQVLPWRPDEKPVARMFCDILQPDGTPYPGDPRYVHEAHAGQGRRERLHQLSGTGTGVLLFRRQYRHRSPGPGRLFRRPAPGRG